MFGFFLSFGAPCESHFFFCFLPQKTPNNNDKNDKNKNKPGVLGPGLVEIAKELPPQWGAPPVALSLERARADAVRFDSDGDGTMSEEKWDEAALTHIDIMEWGILRLGTLCDALPPVKAMGH